MKKSSTQHDQWVGADDAVRAAFPHIHAWFSDEDEFRRILVKAKPDATFLAVASGYGPDGGKLVCFGSGYGVVGALMGLDRAIQGGNWKVDKPWSPQGTQREVSR